MASVIRKVPLQRGAQWMMRTLALPWRSRTGLAPLALIYGLCMQVTMSFVSPQAGAGTAAFAALGGLLVATLLIVGMLHAARACDAGRPSSIAALLRQARTARLGPLGAALLSQLAVAIAAVAIVYVVVGPEALQRLANFYTTLQANVAQGVPLDPEALLALPLQQVLFACLLLLGLGLLSIVFGLTMIPDLVFGEAGLWRAMRNSAVVCFRNAPAVLLMLVLAFCFYLAAIVTVGIAQELARLVVGNAADVVGQSLLQAFGAVLFCGGSYFVWKDALSDSAADAT